METRAYNESYLSHAMDNLAAMMDCGINLYGISPSLFFSRFITSGVAGQFEKGNPEYLVGHSGCELADLVIELSGGGTIIAEAEDSTIEKSPEYWAGWVLAYYQWRSCRSFDEMRKNGLDIPEVIAMYYPLHEAGQDKFADIAESIVSKNRGGGNPLKDARTRMGLTQKDLSAVSGVSLRMIRAYEQKNQDVAKAEFGTVSRLAEVLKIPILSLLTTV